MNYAIGQSIQRKEAWNKVTGRAQYVNDLPAQGTLSARLLTSPHAHARILNIDTGPAWAVAGVKAVLTGSDCSLLFGILLRDRPALAVNVVRYAGEPVAMVVATDEQAAELAVRCISVKYEPLPVVLKPSDALTAEATPIHPQLGDYRKAVTDIHPEAGTNIASRYLMRKGDPQTAFSKCDVVVSKHFFLPPSGI